MTMKTLSTCLSPQLKKNRKKKYKKGRIFKK